MSRNDYLFSDVDCFSVLENQRGVLQKEIAAMSPNAILSTPIDDICDDLKKRFWIEVPSLDKEGIHANQKEVDIDVSHDRNRHFMRPGQYFIKGTEVAVTIPFLGDAEVFKIRPSTFTSMPPRGVVQNQNLILRFVDEKLDPKVVKTSIDRQLAEIEGYLRCLESDFRSFNNSIVQQYRPQIEGRKTKLLADQNLLGELGFPLRPRTSQPSTYAPPSIRRKLKPEVSTRKTVQAFRPEPALPNDDYEHILKVLGDMTVVMERSPSAFKSMDEESLRTHFLMQLNGHYEGQATGETFNYEGKTDILVRVDGQNIFIGECKFWEGPRKLLETIDQILSYSSWRDTKVALIIFNRNKNFTAVLNAIKDTVPTHPNFKRSLNIEGETRSRYVLSHKDDPSREMIVSILAFDVPVG
jgi:hypothetical protein